jgi:hypothetical protein
MSNKNLLIILVCACAVAAGMPLVYAQDKTAEINVDTNAYVLPPEQGTFISCELCVTLYPEQPQMCSICRGAKEYFQPAQMMTREMAQMRLHEIDVDIQNFLYETVSDSLNQPVPIESLKELRKLYRDKLIHLLVHNFIEVEPVKEKILQLDVMIVENGASKDQLEHIQEKIGDVHYRKIAKRIIDKIISLKEKYPHFAQVNKIATVEEAEDKLWIAFHYTHGMSMVPNPNYLPGKKGNKDKKVFSQTDGIDLHIYFFKGPWDGQAVAIPQKIGELNVVVLLDGRILEQGVDVDDIEDQINQIINAEAELNTASIDDVNLTEIDFCKEDSDCISVYDYRNCCSNRGINRKYQNWYETNSRKLQELGRKS